MSDIPIPSVQPIVLPHEHKKERLMSWVASVDHKQIGIMYMVTAFIFFLIGGLEALLMRTQLMFPEEHFLSPSAYDQIFTMHGTTMVFLFGMPILIGLANYLVPLMIGARDVAFPRLNAFGYWLLVFGGLMLYFSFLAGGAPNAGWFSYAPLSEKPFSTSPGLTYWALGLLATGIGSVSAAINLLVTVITLRVKGMKIRRLPLFVWMTLVTSVLIILALPALNADLVMLLIDRKLGGNFFVSPAAGSSEILWQHFFWAFGHPEVYILALPAFGIISEVIPVFSRKAIFGYGYIAASTVAIGILSFAVWAHHMFAVGLGHPWDVAFAAGSMLIAIPTGVKIFNWVATLYGGSIRFTTSMLYAIGFLIFFTIGGLSGVTLAVFPIDWQVHDTYYIVAHLHYVLFGGTAFAVFAGLYYWFPKFTGRMLSEKLGKWNFWLTVIGFNTTFMVQHALGILGMPRRAWTYPNLPYWGLLNLISTIGVYILTIAILVLIANIWISLKHGEKAGNNPWKAWSLEWATTSPPPEENFERVPPVRSRRPLWDLEHPNDTDWMHGNA